MKFEILRSDLLPAIKQIAPLARGSKFPILSCCLLQTGESGLSLRATDLEADLTIQLPAEVSIPGSCCLPADRLRAITQELDAGSTISMEADAKWWTGLQAGKSRFRLATLSHEDYPEPFADARDGGVSLSLPGPILYGLISRTAYAAAENGRSHQALSGLLWRVAGDILTLVATDGHRLALSTHDFLSSQEEVTPRSIEAILPADGLKPLLAMLGGVDAKVDLTLHPRGARFSTPAWWSYSLRALEGPYPEYEYVIPKTHSRELICDRHGLAHAISICSLINNKGDAVYSGVRLEMAGGIPLVVSAKNELGEAREEMDAVYIGEPLSLLMSTRYLRGALERGCEGSSEVRLLMAGPADAITVVGVENGCGVIMPMREN